MSVLGPNDQDTSGEIASSYEKSSASVTRLVGDDDGRMLATLDSGTGPVSSR